MEYESLAPWWPEPDDIVAEACEMPIFSPPPSVADLYFAGLGSVDEEQELQSEGSYTLSDPNIRSVEEKGTSEELAAAIDEGNAGNKGSRNLVSERNRRKRINQQLIALRSLVPYMSKMGKRSILIDAAKYVEKLHSEIEHVKREIEEQNINNGHEQRPHLSSDHNLMSQPLDQEEAPSHLAQHHIYKVETNEINDGMLSVKLVFRNFMGALLKVQQMIESMGPTVTHTWSHVIDAEQMTTTSYLHYKKHENIGAEMLKEQVTKAAINEGFEINLD